MNIVVKVLTYRRLGGHIGLCSFEAVDESGKVCARGEFETPICATPERALQRAKVEAEEFLAAVSHG